MVRIEEYIPENFPYLLIQAQAAQGPPLFTAPLYGLESIHLLAYGKILVHLDFPWPGGLVCAVLAVYFRPGLVSGQCIFVSLLCFYSSSFCLWIFNLRKDKQTGS
jgi:hypothetical protein